MKLWVGLILLFNSAVLLAQKPKADFAAIDWYVQSIKADTPNSLAAKLAAPYTTELEKVRALYSWICQNIRYNADIFRPLA